MTCKISTLADSAKSWNSCKSSMFLFWEKKTCTTTALSFANWLLSTVLDDESAVEISGEFSTALKLMKSFIEQNYSACVSTSAAASEVCAA